MAGIKDQISMDIKINGQPVAPGINMFGDTLLVHNARYPVPFLRVTFGDSNSALSGGQQMAEGTKIQIRFNRFSTDDSTPYYEFIAFNRLAGGKAGDGNTPQGWLCFLNVPLFWTTIKQHGIKGSSSDVMKTIAKQIGCKPVCDNTADVQQWLNFSSPLTGFARQVCAHGFANNSSAMMMSVRPNKELHYVDVVARMKAEPKLRILSDCLPLNDGKMRECIAQQIQFKSDSGVSNALFNYGYDVHFDGPSGTMAKADKYAAKRSTPKLNMNAELKSKLGTARVEHYAMSRGNTHSRFEQAAHQNARGLALFSDTVTVLVNDMTKVDVFDVVELRVGRGQYNTQALNNAGNYMVFAKAQVSKNGKGYAEALILVRNGTFETGTTPLV